MLEGRIADAERELAANCAANWIDPTPSGDPLQMDYQTRAQTTNIAKGVAPSPTIVTEVPGVTHGPIRSPSRTASS